MPRFLKFFIETLKTCLSTRFIMSNSADMQSLIRIWKFSAQLRQLYSYMCDCLKFGDHERGKSDNNTQRSGGTVAWPSGRRVGLAIRNAESYSDHLFLGSPGPEFKSSVTLVNSQLVCLRPVGILNNVNLKVCSVWIICFSCLLGPISMHLCYKHWGG